MVPLYKCKKKYFSRLYSLVAISILLLTLCLSGCKKLVEVDPPLNSLVGSNIFLTDATAISVLTGLYVSISGSSVTAEGDGFLQSLTLYTGLSSDELALSSIITAPGPLAYYQNNFSVSSATISGSEYWSNMYYMVYQCNAAIAGLDASGSLTPAVKQQLLGEAKFIRALHYFYLVNLYGDVPLSLGTDPAVNAVLARTPASKVYDQIIADLTDAQVLLSTNFLDATLLNTTPDRVRPSSWAATALLARVYLYNGDWADAVTQSSALISNTAQFSLSPLANVFLRASSGNKEAIWQLQPVTIGNSANTSDASAFIMPTTGPGQTGTSSTGLPVSNFGAYLSTNLVNSFEPGDNRANIWVGNITVAGTTYYFPYKYKATSGTVVEHEMILRLGEQYLIRAEAEANGAGGGLPDAIADLNVIRIRAGLPAYSGPSTQADLLAAIYHERQVELFCELGHRWLDLKRTQTVDAVMGASTGTIQKTNGALQWKSYQQLYPVPYGDILYDPNLVQNPGY